MQILWENILFRYIFVKRYLVSTFCESTLYDPFYPNTQLTVEFQPYLLHWPSVSFHSVRRILANFVNVHDFYTQIGRKGGSITSYFSPKSNNKVGILIIKKCHIRRFLTANYLHDAFRRIITKTIPFDKITLWSIYRKAYAL